MIVDELACNFKVGDILFSCWGYNVTIVSFYRILKKTPKNTFTLQKLDNTIVNGDWMAGDSVPGNPIPDCVINRRPNQYCHLWGKNSKYEFLVKWDGTPKRHNRFD